MLPRLLAITCLAFTAGCATIVEGTDQTLNVEITPESAICTLTQKGDVIGQIGDGGGQVQVPKSKEDIAVSCEAPGHRKRIVQLESSASGWGVVGCFLIDLCITDYSTGALNKYQETVRIKLAAAAPAGPGGVPAPPPAATMPPVRSAPPESAPPDVPTRVAAPGGTPQRWRTAHGSVRAYWGQSETESFAMPASVPLAIVKSNGKWGLFEYTGTDGQRGQVWILKSDVLVEQ